MTRTAADLRLYFKLQITAHQLKRLSDQRLQAASGVTTAQAAVLTLIRSSQPVSQRAIARQLRQQESAITAMIGRLIKLGLVDRTRATDDHRSWELTLTSAGRETLTRARPAFDAINSLIESSLSGTDLTRLAASLEKLNAAIADVEP